MVGKFIALSKNVSLVSFIVRIEVFSIVLNIRKPLAQKLHDVEIDLVLNCVEGSTDAL